MTRCLPRLLPLLVAGTLSACENQVPTAVNERLLPVGPVTVEVRLPWSQVASGLKVLGGYGSPREVGLGFVANDYEGTLDARTLFHLAPFPTEASVPDSLGTTRIDTNLQFIEGQLLVRFDVGASTRTGPVTISAGRTLEQWDANTADWEHAVDSLARTVRWEEPGGGRVDPFLSTEWQLGVDSLAIPLDSAMVAALADPESDRGVRLSLDTPGERLQIRGIALNLIARPSVHPDTLITLTVSPSDVTFIYTPAPPAPTDLLRVGGIPAWRTVFSLALPTTVAGNAETCARVTCPLQITPDRITYAALVLTTAPTEAAFRPTDSLAIEARSVLAPDVLPKSPLGQPLFFSEIGRTIGASLPFEAFAPGASRTVELAITPLVVSLVRGETFTGQPASPTLALLSLQCPSDITACFESRSLTYASFVGPGSPGEPYLKLLLTISATLELP